MITEHFEVLIKQTYHTCKIYWKTHAWQYNILLGCECISALFKNPKYWLKNGQPCKCATTLDNEAVKLGL